MSEDRAMSDEREMEAALEAVLFVTPEPVSAEKLLEIFPPEERERAGVALERVLDRYRQSQSEDGRGIMLDEAAGGFRLVTRPELHGYLKRFFEAADGNRLSMASLETLAIVAYRQPITAPEIHELRGKNSSGVLKTLLERRLVRISGRKEVVGRPFLYATTRDFLLHFGLRGLSDLPPLEELEESFAEGDFSGFLEEKPEDREEQVLQQLALVEDQVPLEEDHEAFVEDQDGEGIDPDDVLPDEEAPSRSDRFALGGEGASDDRSLEGSGVLEDAQHPAPKENADG